MTYTILAVYGGYCGKIVVEMSAEMCYTDTMGYNNIMNLDKQHNLKRIMIIRNTLCLWADWLNQSRVTRKESGMAQVNIMEAKTDLSELVRLLETHQEEVILIARDGTPVVEMKLAQRKPASKRIGVAKGKLQMPDDFDKWDSEIAGMFGDKL